MSSPEFMFLFEIMVDEIESSIKYRDLSIRTQFADLFSVLLKNADDISIPKCVRENLNRRRVRIKDKTEKITAEFKEIIGQTVLITTTDSLIINMKSFPLQIFFCPRNDTEYIIGSTYIPWRQAYIDYLNNIIRNTEVPSVSCRGKYNIFDEMSSKRMATVRMTIKLSCLQDNITANDKYFTGDNQYIAYENNHPILRTIKEKRRKIKEEFGIIKTVYSSGKNMKHYPEDKISTASTKLDDSNNLKRKGCETKINLITEMDDNNECVIKKANDLEMNKEIVLKSKSHSSLEFESHLNTLNYIFGDGKGPFGNREYCVGYFTVQNDKNTLSKETAKDVESSQKSIEHKDNIKFNICDSECPIKSSQSHYSLDLPAEAAPFISITKCGHIKCDAKKHRETPPPIDDRVLIDLSSMRKDCCGEKIIKEMVETVVGGVTAKLEIGEKDPCYCSCECKFGYTKKTTYCVVCGGFETIGEKPSQPDQGKPFPCPIFHKLVDKSKQKSYSSFGSDIKKRGDGSGRSSKEKKSSAGSDPEKDIRQSKTKKNNDNDTLKLYYGYKAPQIGHSRCAMPCSGTLSNVPKGMGWLWTADNVPGMKFRPNWKPGAVHKNVLRLLKMARNPGHVKAKKRRKDTGKKRPLKRPLLTVHKKEGEYTVTMETMKTYTKQRSINQHPYEDKPVVTYKIGRSEEENRERQRKKERAQRRLERDQRHFIQSAFQDLCKDICIKTYQQALGLLPGAEDPDCTCYPAQPGPDKTNLDISCSCSEDSASLGSTTDSDEWIVEFTPPNALFDPTFKGKKIFRVDNSTQYSYLDYRVKMADRFGSPVPRFFTGPDGKKQCSDLGGFWGPDHKWLEINVDGFIAPDNRWAPNVFIGPNGDQVDAETGKFQITNNKWLTVGIEGYVDSQGRWRFYSRQRRRPIQNTLRTGKKDVKADDKKPVAKPSDGTWSCFGDASPRDLGKMGIMGHGLDRKLLLATLQKMLDRGEDVSIPRRPLVPRLPGFKKGKRSRVQSPRSPREIERMKCRHPVPSEKGIVAMDAHGNKTYFRLKDYESTRPKERLSDLTHQGISLSSFHVPCLNSFITSDMVKQQMRERYGIPQRPTVETKAN